jgi:hypothetical protein
MSPHLLRPYSPRQLGLVEGNERLMVFASMSPYTAGPSLVVHAPTLSRRLAELPHLVEVVAFIGGPVPDLPMLAHLDDMVGYFEQIDTDCLVDYVAVTEAIKEVEGDRVVRGIPRGPLVSFRPPEVMTRPSIEAALDKSTLQAWVDPASLVVAAAGRITLYPWELSRR